ncbi:MAG: hypothetical protein BJ554DRAFT_7560, partial [Olpidium bornovanus]
MKRLKSLLSSADVLRELDYRSEAGPVYLTVDAGPCAAGWVLSQEEGESRRPARFVAKIFNHTQRAYGQTKRELYAIWLALREERQHVLGANLMVETDCRPLIKMMSNYDTADASSRRWVADVKEYGCLVVHIKGEDNAVADMLSRTRYEGDGEELSPAEDGEHASEGRTTAKPSFDVASVDAVRPVPSRAVTTRGSELSRGGDPPHNLEPKAIAHAPGPARSYLALTRRPDSAAANRRSPVDGPAAGGARPSPKRGGKQQLLTIVSAASTNHACELQNLARSVHEARARRLGTGGGEEGAGPPAATAAAAAEPRFVAYDLGINDTYRALFEELRSQGVIQELRMFNYSAYPPHVNVSRHRGHYAWKPLILEEVARRIRAGVVVWMDAGNLVTDPQFFADVVRNVRSPPPPGPAGGPPARPGFWSPRSSDDMGRWTHPGMFEYFGDPERRHTRSPNCNGALLAFDCGDP